MTAMTPTWYDLLGVEPGADADEIRAAWRSAIADLDPTERRFATLNEAAAVLLDPARRSAYDAELRVTEPAPEANVEPEPEPEPEAEAEAVPTSSTSETTTSAQDPAGPPLWVLATVGVVAVALTALAIVLATLTPAAKVVQTQVQLSGGSTVSDVEEPAIAALAAAKADVVPLLTYDYRHLDEDKAAAEKVMTDAYRTGRDGKKGYDAVFEALRPSILSTQTVIAPKVVGSAIVRAEQDRVQVLVLVDRSRTNKADATPALFQDQATLTMQKVGGRWLIDDVRTDQIPE